jgi:hypothetical protein
LESSPLVEYGKEVFGRVWLTIRRLVTSRSAPELLSAVFPLDPSSTDVVASSRAAQCADRLRITAVNTGQSVWLAAGRSDKGAVKLIWRWVKEGKEASGFASAEPLRHDVFPGRSHRFRIPFLHVPPEPDRYVLELGMASKTLSKFTGWGKETVAIPVTVPAWTTGVFHVPLMEEMPLGHYTLYFFFTEAGSYQSLLRRRDNFSWSPNCGTGQSEGTCWLEVM